MMRVIGIALKREPHGEMELLERAEVTTDGGITGDCRGRGGGKKKRQITILTEEQWEEACWALGVDLPWHRRRANLFLRGQRLGPTEVGKLLHIGDSVILEITGETKPCRRMDEALPGLQNALTANWRGGVTCRVISGGIFKNNTEVVLL